MRFNGRWALWSQRARSAIFSFRPLNSGWTPRASTAALEEEEEEVIRVIEGDAVLPGHQDPESCQARYDGYNW